MNKRYQISYYLRIILVVIVYVVFFAYIIYSCLHAKDQGNLIFNILIGILVGGTGLLFEALRICYDAATKKLIIEGRPDVTLKLLDKVEKFDLFKAFRTSCQMMRMLAMIDLRDFNGFKEYSRNLQSNDYDVEITRKYCEMIAEGESGNKGRSNEAFKQLLKLRDLKDKKGRRNRGAFYFNWEVVNGQHKNYEKDYDGAFRYLKDIDESNMNLRELMHYLLAKTVASSHCGQNQIYETSKERLLNVCANNPVMKGYSETL